MAKDVERSPASEPVVTTREKKVERVNSHRMHKPWILAIVASSVLLILLLVGGAIGMFMHGAGRYDERYERGMHMNGGYGYTSVRFGGMGYNAGNTATTNVTRLNGVVTAIDGNTLTVAGSGKTTKVEVGSATIYNGDATSAAVNDTVGVLGNKNSDGSIAASQITISRQ